MSERIEDMATNTACEAANAYQAARASRQIMYQLTKLVPSYQDMFDDMQATYLKLCDRLGVAAEPVFDEDEYKRSDHYKKIMEGTIR